MRERGQVFTLDMLFALILAASFVAVSGQALEIASNQGRSYSTRYSLERTVNDAADVLVKTLGAPSDWVENIEKLATPGLVEENNGKTLQNTLDVRKLGLIRELCRAGNWDTTKSEVQAVMNLFGGSEKFEIKVVYKELLAREKLDAPAGDDVLGKTWNILGVEVDVEADNEGDVIDVEVELEWDKEVETGTERAPEFVLVVEGGGITVEVVEKGGMIEVWYRVMLWDIWPGWDVEDSSGVKNSLEVAVVRRLVAMRAGDVAAESGKIGLGEPGKVTDNLEFEIPLGGLEAFDWYIVVTTGSGRERGEEAKFFVNREIRGTFDYRFRSKPDLLEDTFPKIHGGIENDLPDPPRTGEIHEGSNYLNIKATAGTIEAWIKVYVIALPACSSWETAILATRILPATLEVNLWR